MAEYKNQHYVHQQYLKPWGTINPNNKSEKIPFILDKNTSEIKQKNSKKILNESYFYKLEKLDEAEKEELLEFLRKKILIINDENKGVTNKQIETIMTKLFNKLCHMAKSNTSQTEIEQSFFPEIEPTGYKVIDKIISNDNVTLTDEESTHLIQYISFAHHRTLSFKKSIQKTYQSDINIQNFEKIFPYIMIIDGFLEGADLLSKTEGFHIKKASHLLITGDSPVIKYNDFLIFTISPKIYLMSSLRNGTECSIKESEINNMLFEQAEDIVIASTAKCLEKLLE